MSEPRCKMSVFIEEICPEANICAFSILMVQCDGMRGDSNNCPFWKRGDGTS